MWKSLFHNKAIVRKVRQSWFTEKQWRTDRTAVKKADCPSNEVAASNLLTRSINASGIPKGSFGSDNANSDRGKKSSHKCEYDFSKITPIVEAASWLGTSFVLAVNLKLRLHELHRKHCYQYGNETESTSYKWCIWQGFPISFSQLWSRALSMPYAKRSVLPETSKPTIASEGKKVKESENSPSDKGYEEMKIASSKYIGHIENMIGLQLLSKDPGHAFRHFRIAADLGCNKGNFNLGLCYELGRGTQQDLSKAAHCYKLAASDGHGFAMYNLGIYYIDGLGGLEQDESKGLQLIQKAAELEVPEAQNFMGVHCLDNEQLGEAFVYFEQSANQEFADSQYYLGLCYANGWGAKIDYIEAAKHFSAAATKGHEEAKLKLQNYPDKHQDMNTDHKKVKRQQNMEVSIHSSSSSPELSRMGSPTSPHPLTNFDLPDCWNMNIQHIWQKVDHKRNHWFDLKTAAHTDNEQPHWASTPSLLTVN